MAVTITKDTPLPIAMSKGRTYRYGLLTGTITFDSSYPSSGELVAAITSAFSAIKSLVVSAAGYIFVYDVASAKLKVYVPVSVIASTGTAATNNFVFKSAAGTLEVDGTGTAFQQVAAEVLDTTDLSAVVATYVAFGLI
jgi:hypothetical protein